MYMKQIRAWFSKGAALLLALCLAMGTLPLQTAYAEGAEGLDAAVYAENGTTVPEQDATAGTGDSAAPADTSDSIETGETAGTGDTAGAENAELPSPTGVAWDEASYCVRWTPSSDMALMYSVLAYYLDNGNQVPMGGTTAWASDGFCSFDSAWATGGNGTYRIDVTALSSDSTVSDSKPASVEFRYTMPAALAAPTNLKWENWTVSWTGSGEDAVDHYDVLVYFSVTPEIENDVRFVTGSAAYDHETSVTFDSSIMDEYGPGYYYFQVRAISRNAAQNANSDWVQSAPQHFAELPKLPTPTGVRWDAAAGAIRWDPAASQEQMYEVTFYRVEGASRVWVDFYEVSASQRVCAIDDWMADRYEPGSYTAAVRALSSDAAFANSDVASVEFTLNAPPTLHLRPYDAASGTYGEPCTEFVPGHPEVPGENVKTFGVFLGDRQLTADEYTFEVTYNRSMDITSHKFKDTVTVDDSGRLVYTFQASWIELGKPADIYVTLRSEYHENMVICEVDLQKHCVDFDYNGKTYTLLMSGTDQITGGTDLVGYWGGDRGTIPETEGPDPAQTLEEADGFITIFEDINGPGKREAKELLGLIKNVDYSVTENSQNMLSVESLGKNQDGYYAFHTALAKVVGSAFLNIDVTLELNGQTVVLPLQYYCYNSAFSYAMSGRAQHINVYCEEEGITTIEDLEQRLAELVERSKTEAIAQVNFYLAPVTYQGTWTIKDSGDFAMTISGRYGVDAKNAVIEGGILLDSLETNVASIWNISFAAPSDQTGATYGIRCEDGGSCLAVDNCKFGGYDAAVSIWSTEGLSGISAIDCCLFENNVSAIRNEGGHTPDVFYCAFRNNEIAIEIRSAKTSEAPRDRRFYGSDFVGNGTDLKAPEGGMMPYYLYCDYFFHESAEDPYAPITVGNVLPGPQLERESGVADYVKAALDGNIDYVWSRDNLPPLSIPKTTNETNIRNDLADELIVDAAAFDGRTADLDVHVVDSEGQSVADWRFDAENQSQVSPAVFRMAMAGRAAAEKGFNGGVTVSEDGTSVTVVDSAPLHTKQPTLTVPCTIENAVVTRDGKEVVSTLEGGKISFTVSQGGEYKIATRDDSEIRIAEVTAQPAQGNQIAVTVTMQAPEQSEPGITVTPVVALYDKDGRLVGMTIGEKATLAEAVGKQVTLTAKADGTPVKYRVFLLDGTGEALPLCAAVEAALKK